MTDNGRRFASTVAVSAVAIVAVIIAGFAATGSAFWTDNELAVLQAMSDAHTAPLTALAMAVNFFFGTTFAPVVVLGCAVVIGVVSKRWSLALRFAVVVGVAWGGNQLIKLIVDRPRPPRELLSHPLLTESSYSFPSGHTAIAASLGVAFVILCWRTRARVWVIAGAAVIAVATALSRMYLGVHYPTDVVASLVYSTAAVTLLNAVWQRILGSRTLRW